MTTPPSQETGPEAEAIKYANELGVPVCRFMGIIDLARAEERRIHAELRERHHVAALIIVDQVEEVKNETGGVIGYTLSLDAVHTRALWDLLEPIE